MNKKNNMAIVGCGTIAQSHLQTLKKLRDLQVVAVCDLDEQKALATAKKWKINRYYTDFHKMLNNEDIFLLSILTPPTAHSHLAIDAIRNGIHVLIEKPLTMTTKEADSIINVLRGSSAKLTVVYHWLFTKAMLKALSLISEQKIGEVLHANINVLSNSAMDPMASDPDHWCHRILGGRFGEMLPHPVYVLQSIMGDTLEKRQTWVFKRGNVPWMPYDELHAFLQDKREVGSLYISFNAPRESTIVDVYGTKKILRIDLTRQMVLQYGSMTQGKLSTGKDSLAEAFRLMFLTLKNAFEYAFHPYGDVSDVYTMFINNIRNGVNPLVSPEMAYNTVRIVEEICEDIMQVSKKEQKESN